MAESASAKRWLPLEANPDVMNQVPLSLTSSKSSICLSSIHSIRLMINSYLAA